MADNVPITAGSGTDVATDQVTGTNEHVQLMKVAISEDGSRVLIPADATNGLDVDVTRVSGNVTVVQPTASNLNANVSGTVSANQSGTWNVGLNAGSNAIGSITNTSFAATQSTPSSLQNKPYGAATTAAPTYSTGTDNPLSLTTAGALRVDNSAVTQPVSGTVSASQSGTWNVGLNAGSNAIGSITNTSFEVTQATAANLNATVTGTVSANQSGTWNVGLNAGSNAIGSITNTSFAATQATASSLLNKPYGAVTTAAPSYSNGTDNALSLTTGGALRVDGSAVTQPVSGTVTANAGTGSFTVAQATAANLNATVTVSGVVDVEGNVAHDAVDSGNPAKIGAKAVSHGANPTAVAAADRTDLYANRHGILFTIGGHPNIITRSVRIADADNAQTNASMVGTINAGTKVAVTALAVTVDSATTNTGGVAVKIGFGASTISADSATGADGVLLDHDGISAGSGVVIGNGSGILGIGGDGEELRLTCEDPVSGSIVVTFSYFTIDS